MGKPLEDDGRALHLVGEGPVDVDLAGPMPPPGNGFLQPAVEFLCAGRGHQPFVQILRAAPENRQVCPLTFTDRPFAGEFVAVGHGQGFVAGDQQTVAAAHGDEAIFSFLDPGSDTPVVEDGHHFDGQAHPPFDPFRDAQDLPVRVVFTAFMRGHAVDQAHAAFLVFEGRLEHQAIVHVAPRNLAGRCGVNLAEAPLVPIQQAPETARRIVARQAAPVDGTGPGNQGGPMTVGDVAVVGNRGIGRVSAHGASPWRAVPAVHRQGPAFRKMGDLRVRPLTS